MAVNEGRKTIPDNVCFKDLGYFQIQGDIEESTARDAIEFILEANENPERYPNGLRLFVCSYGGMLHPALAIVDAMLGSTLPIATVALGQNASAATFIVAAGAVGSRIATEMSTFMTHQYAGFRYGKHHELVAARDNEDMTNAAMVKMYLHLTGMTEETLRERFLTTTDKYFDAEVAKEYGFVDTVVKLQPRGLNHGK